MRWLRRKVKSERAARRKPKPPWVRTAVRAGVRCGVVVVAVALPVWAVQSGLVARVATAVWQPAVTASAGLGLTVRQVLAEGRVETTQAEVLAALRVRGGEPILGIDPETARARVEALPWVRSAAVERRLPDTIRVRLVERRAMAWWQKDGKLVLIDHAGEPIKAPATPRFAELIVLVGDDAPKHAAALITMLKADPELAPRVRAAVRVGERRWNLRIDGTVEIRLPEDGAEAAWARLGELERKNRILSRDIEAVDLRLPDRLIVQTKGARPASANGRDT